MSAEDAAWKAVNEERERLDRAPRVTAAEGTARWQAVETLREVVARLREDMGHVNDGYCLACDDEPDAALSLLEQLAEAAERHCGRIDAPEYLRNAVEAVRSGRADA